MLMAVAGSSRPRVVVDGRFFRLGDKKFYVKGVAYGPLPPNAQGQPFASPEQTALDLDQIRDLGELRVVTRNSPTAYYLGANGPEGPEYELANRFAGKLGVALYIYTVPRLAMIKDEITSGRAHLAAAGLTVSDDWKDAIVYGPAYQQIRQHLVYRMGQPKPRDMAAVNGGHLEVIAGSRHAELLRELRNSMPDLVWVENHRDESLDLAARVASGDIDYTITDSTEFALAHALYPEIRVAFDLPDEQQVAWALGRRDASLTDSVRAFFAEQTARTWGRRRG